MDDVKTPTEAAEFLKERFRSHLPPSELEALGRLVEGFMTDWAYVMAENAAHDATMAATN